MALIVDKELSSGIVVNGAYCRIDTVIGSKNLVEYSVGVYASKKAFLNDKPPLDSIEYYSFVPNILSRSENFIRQAFYDLKKREGYEQGSDVFEEGQ